MAAQEHGHVVASARVMAGGGEPTREDVATFRRLQLGLHLSLCHQVIADFPSFAEVVEQAPNRASQLMPHGSCRTPHDTRHTPCMCDIACNLCKRLVFGLLVSLQPRQTSQTSIHVTREQQRQHKSRIHRVETRSSQTVRRIRLLAPNVTMPISMSMSSFKSRKPSNVTPCSSNSWAYFAKLAIRCRELTARA